MGAGDFFVGIFNFFIYIIASISGADTTVPQQQQMHKAIVEAMLSSEILPHSIDAGTNLLTPVPISITPGLATTLSAGGAVLLVIGMLIVYYGLKTATTGVLMAGVGTVLIIIVLCGGVVAYSRLSVMTGNFIPQTLLNNTIGVIK